MTSFDTRVHFRVIRGELQQDEYLLWWGRPYEELQGPAQRMAELLIVSLVCCGFGLFMSIGIADTFEDLPVLTFLIPPIALPLAFILWQVLSHLRHREATLYALTNRRVIRATGRERIMVESVRLADMSDIELTDWGSKGTIWSMLPERASASGMKKGRYAIVRGITNPREVYDLIVSARPELLDQGTDTTATLP